jgi:glycosyltransferase involved in cell wall biosynthesis
MSRLTTSVVIASRRPAALTRCLQSLTTQSTLPDEVIVAWQGDDTATQQAATALIARVPYSLRVVHSLEVGIVPAENAALDAAAGELILLIDDDALAPSDWVARHVSHYADPQVGAVGGPFDNYETDGTRYVRRSREPVGTITWYGKPYGNMHDQLPEWRDRPPRPVAHLAGGNMSLRRVAFDRFETRLKPYWQFFEMDACLQVAARGYRLLFDFTNVVDHYPTTRAFAAGRDGDLAIKMHNPAFNHAFILAKHLRGWRRVAGLAFVLVVGTTAAPGGLGALVGIWRYGKPLREFRLLGRTCLAHLDGWRAGCRARQEAGKGWTQASSARAALAESAR